MITLIDGLPDNVIGAIASGEVDDDDYEDVLDPAIADKLTRHDKIRFLYVFDAEFEGYESDAALADAKLGMRTFTKWERIAVVTDSKLIGRSVAAMGFLMPGHVKWFSLGDQPAATTWVTSDD
jgi:hypothetical protein